MRRKWYRFMGAFLCGTMVLSSVMLYPGATPTMADDKMNSEHYHTFTCYAGYVITCGASHGKSEHREECFAGTGKLVCGIVDGKLHSHNEDTCHVAESVLSCAHSGSNHDLTCYNYVYSCREASLSSLNEEGGVRNEDELKEAISANSGVIKLAGSFSVKNSINIGATIEIDLNGYNITYLGSDSLFNVTGWGNKLVIRDSMYTGPGKVVTEQCDEAGVAKYNAASDSVVWYTTESTYSGMLVKSKLYKNTLKLGSSGTGSIKAAGAKAIVTLENNGFLEIHGGLLQNTDGMNIIAAPAGHIDMFGGYLMNSGSDKDSGGAVYVKSGSFEMFNGAICGNRGRQGGAIRGDTWTSIGLYGGIIAGNSALYNGGALYTLNSSVDINNTVLVGNTSGEGGGAYYSYISRNDVGKLAIKNSTFAGNKATTTGGAVHLNNTGYEVDNEFIASVIVNNIAKTGGGLYVENSTLVCEDTDVSFNNTVEDGAGVRFTGNSLQLLGACKLLGNVVRDSKKSRIDQNLFDMNDTGLYVADTCILEREYTVGEMNEVSSWQELKHVMETAQDYVTTNIKLTKDLEADSTIVVKGNPDLQLQLNGHNISNGNLRGVNLIKLTGKGAGLTVTDNTAVTVDTVEVGAASAEDAGKLCTYQDGLVTYYTAVSKTLKGGLHTEEILYRNTIDLNSKLFGGFVCTGLDSIVNVLNGSTLVIDGGVLQNEDGNHAVRVEDSSVCKINGGCIIGSGVSSSVAGNYDDGYFDAYNGAGVFVANNSELYMTGGFVVANKASADGGGIFVRDADVVRLTGGVIAGNSADIVGGGVSFHGDNSDVLLDGITVAGNRAKGKLPQYEMYNERHGERVYGGGGVFSSSGTELVVDGDTLITENVALSTSSVLNGFGRGGGGIFSAGSCLIYGGQLTGNKSYASGGGVYSTVGVQNKDTGKWSGSFKMSGGVIAANMALKNEGGGIRTDILNDLFAGDGKRIYITNNMTKTTLDWGGGGLFNTSGSTARTGSLVITDNEARGFGGGVSGCNNGVTTVLPENGAAIYGNIAYADSERIKGWKDYLKCKEDNRNAADKVDARTPVVDTPFIEYGMFDDFYVSNEGHVSGTMLGGGSANWKGSGSDDDRLTLHPTAKSLLIRKGYIANNLNYMGLNSNPSQASVKSALSVANIIVTGNKSGAHGGGIANNGNLTIGEGKEPDPGTEEETTTTNESEETTTIPQETSSVESTTPEETSPVESTDAEETTTVPETSPVETTAPEETLPVETTAQDETSPVETTESVTTTHDESKPTVPETTRRSGGGGSQPPPHGVSEPQSSAHETTVPPVSSTSPVEVVEMPPEETFNFFNPTFPSHTIYESLPNPNNPDSPDFITIFEDGVPKSYFKRWNKDTMQYEYIPDDMVPTGGLPKVGDVSNQWVWRMLFCLSLLGLCVLQMCAVIDNRIQRAGRD